MSDTARRDEVFVRTVLEPGFEFTSAHLYSAMLEANLAHVLSLDHAGLLSADHRRLLAGVCVAMLDDPERFRPVSYDPTYEDLFFMVEARVQSEVGPEAASNMHLAMSRNDLEAALFRMAGRRLLIAIAEQLDHVRATLLAVAEAESGTVMLAHTHNQQAQPTTVGHYMLAAESALARDLERLDGAWHRTNLSPLGAAALAGTGFVIDRQFEASLLGFEGLVENTYDAISAADWGMEIAATAASAASVLGRLVTDLMFWSSNEVGALSLDPSMVQISSIMPQKRNPVALEHARAILGRAAASLAAVTLTLHNIPFGDVNDGAEHVQRQVHSGATELLSGAALLDRALAKATFNRQLLLERARSSLATSTELADTLVRLEGISFRTAHAVVSSLVDRLSSEGRQWASLTLTELDHAFSARAGRPLRMSAAELAAALDPEEFVARRNTLGGPALEAMRSSLKQHSAALQCSRNRWHSRRQTLDLCSQRLRTMGLDAAESSGSDTRR